MRTEAELALEPQRSSRVGRRGADGHRGIGVEAGDGNSRVALLGHLVPQRADGSIEVAGQRQLNGGLRAADQTTLDQIQTLIGA